MLGIAKPQMLKPMLASLTEAPLDDPQFAYEPKYEDQMNRRLLGCVG